MEAKVSEGSELHLICSREAHLGEEDVRKCFGKMEQHDFYFSFIQNFGGQARPECCFYFCVSFFHWKRQPSSLLYLG